MNERLHAVVGFSPDVDVERLRRLADGSLGCEYARFLDANGITPLVISPHIEERFRKNPWVLRYTTTHDLHHVLSGFDTGLPGEAGAYAFTVGQGSAPGGMGYIFFLRLIYPLLAPTGATPWRRLRERLGWRGSFFGADASRSQGAEPGGRAT